MTPADAEDDLVLVIESDDNDTEFRLTVKSISGRKITPNELILSLESYLHDVVQAETQRNQEGSTIH